MRYTIIFVALILSLLASSCCLLRRNCEPVPMPEVVPQESAPTSAWTAADFRSAAQALVEQLLTGTWLADFNAIHNRKPVLMIRSVQNISDDHIPAENLGRELSRELLRSGRVSFVALREDRPQNPELDPAQTMVEATGADFAIKGVISPTGAQGENLRSKLYLVEVSLVDLQSGTLVLQANHTVQIQIHR